MYLDSLWNVRVLAKSKFDRQHDFDTFKIMCRNKLKLFYTDKWLNSVSQSNKGLFYKEYKTELKFENYLVEMNVSLRYFLVKFRTSNHRLPIEEGASPDG